MNHSWSLYVAGFLSLIGPLVFGRWSLQLQRRSAVDPQKRFAILGILCNFCHLGMLVVALVMTARISAVFSGLAFFIYGSSMVWTVSRFLRRKIDL